MNYYDDCANECVDLTEFFEFTGDTYEPDIDLEMPYGKTFRCADPYQASAEVISIRTDDLFATRLVPSFTSSDAFLAADNAAGTWDQAGAFGLFQAELPDILAGSYVGSHALVFTSDPVSGNAVYPGSEIGVLALTEQFTNDPAPNQTLRSATQFYRDIIVFEDDGMGNHVSVQTTPGYTLTGSGNTLSLSTVLAHEMGHALGTGHLLTSTNDLHLMQPIVAQGSIAGFVSNQTEFAFAYLYPPSSGPRLAGSCPQLP